MKIRTTDLHPTPKGAWLGWNRVMPEVVRGPRTENAEVFANFGLGPENEVYD